MQLEVGIQLDIKDIIHYAFDKAFSAKDSQLVSKYKASKLEHFEIPVTILAASVYNII